MLIELFGKNFGCFRDEFRLSMVATPIDEGNDRGIVRATVKGDSEPLTLLRCAAIFGPNASGKSTVLLAASVLNYLMASSAKTNSDEPLGGYLPFLFDPATRTAPVSLGLRGLVDGVVYEYAISFDHKKFLSEHLTALRPEGEARLLDRDESAGRGEWDKDDQFRILAAAFRPNALLLSLADSIAPALAGRIAAGLRQLVQFFVSDAGLPWSFSERTAERANKEPAFAAWLRPRLRDIDIGVADFKTEAVQDPARPAPTNTSGSPPTRKQSFRISLSHAVAGAEPVELPLWRESTGTRRFLDFAPVLFDATHGTEQRAFFVDELDSSIHPVLVRGLVDHFNREVPADQIRGQVVFAGHNVELMEGEARDAVLRRDQVYFTEKDSTGAARLFSLAEFKERNILNVRRRYLQGRYGALPLLGDFKE